MNDKKGECLNCSEEFKKVRFWQKFCSAKCARDWHTERRRQGKRLLEELEKKENQT